MQAAAGRICTLRCITLLLNWSSCTLAWWVGIRVLDGVQMPQGEGEVLFIFGPIDLNGILLTEMYLTRTWKIENISTRTICRWNRRFIGFPKVGYRLVKFEVDGGRGLRESCKKCNSTFDFYRAMHYSASAVLLSLVVCPSVCLSVCDVGGSWPHRWKILETNCANN